MISPLANSVAGVESMVHGGYNAFNTGGANGGRTAYGSGDSSKDMRFGKPIQQLTLGELKRFHNSGQLHATGRYQFIPGTSVKSKTDLVSLITLSSVLRFKITPTVTSPSTC